MTKPIALHTFVKKVSEIDALLSNIKVANDNYYDLSPWDINWGDVADISRVLKALEEVETVLRLYKE